MGIFHLSVVITGQAHKNPVERTAFFSAKLLQKLQLRNGSNRRSIIPALMIGQQTTKFFYSLWKESSKLTQQYYTEPLAGVEGLNSGAILILRDSLKLTQSISSKNQPSSLQLDDDEDILPPFDTGFCCNPK